MSRKTAFLKDKTDAQCRELAAHYYNRARKAEAERDKVKVELDTCRKYMRRLECAALELAEIMEGGE